MCQDSYYLFYNCATETFDIIYPFITCAFFCAALKAWLCMDWIGTVQRHSLVLTQTPGLQSTVQLQSALEHVLYPLCKSGIKQSTVETVGLGLGPTISTDHRDFKKQLGDLIFLNPSLWELLRICSVIKAPKGWVKLQLVGHKDYPQVSLFSRLETWHYRQILNMSLLVYNTL